MAATTSDQPASDVNLYEQIDRYPWESDEDFKAGLEAILGSNPSTEQAVELSLRARCFYYARKFNTHVDFNEYKAWHEQHSNLTNGTTISETPLAQARQASSGAAGQSQSAPYPPSFSEIVELISSGQPIPGIKEIPDTVLTGQETQSSTAKRKKPWEKDSSQTTAAIVAQGSQ